MNKKEIRNFNKANGKHCTGRASWLYIYWSRKIVPFEQYVALWLETEKGKTWREQRQCWIVCVRYQYLAVSELSTFQKLSFPGHRLIAGNTGRVNICGFFKFCSVITVCCYCSEVAYNWFCDCLKYFCDRKLTLRIMIFIPFLFDYYIFGNDFRKYTRWGLA